MLALATLDQTPLQPLIMSVYMGTCSTMEPSLGSRSWMHLAVSLPILPKLMMGFMSGVGPCLGRLHVSAQPTP